jgi:hypothetical protein
VPSSTSRRGRRHPGRVSRTAAPVSRSSRRGSRDSAGRGTGAIRSGTPGVDVHGLQRLGQLGAVRRSVGRELRWILRSAGTSGAAANGAGCRRPPGAGHRPVGEGANDGHDHPDGGAGRLAWRGPGAVTGMNPAAPVRMGGGDRGRAGARPRHRAAAGTAGRAVHDGRAAPAPWGIGVHLGTPRWQNATGELSGEVRDELRLYGEVREVAGASSLTRSSRARARTAGPLRFHTDRCDVALLCVRRAARGGESKVCSSVVMSNAILERRPDRRADRGPRPSRPGR